jgi:hypothetical protein
MKTERPANQGDPEDQDVEAGQQQHDHRARRGAHDEEAAERQRRDAGQGDGPVLLAALRRRVTAEMISTRPATIERAAIKVRIAPAIAVGLAKARAPTIRLSSPSTM